MELHDEKKGNIMRIFYAKDGKNSRLKNHIDVRVPRGEVFVITEEASGCQVQEISSSSIRPVIRFRIEEVKIDTERKKLQAWYVAKSTKDFCKFSIRLAKPYIFNLKWIEDELCSTLLHFPVGLARGTNLDEVPGNIRKNEISGLRAYVPKPSKLTHELAKLLGEEEQVIDPSSLGYWALDRELLNDGVLVAVGNEENKEYVRYLKVGSLPEGKDILTAYIRPWICKEYDL